MEHPFLSSQSLSDLALNELQTKISDLYKKLAWAQRMGHSQLIHQVSMVLESHNVAYQKKVQEEFDKRNIGNKIRVEGQKSK